MQLPCQLGILIKGMETGMICKREGLLTSRNRSGRRRRGLCHFNRANQSEQIPISGGGNICILPKVPHKVMQSPALHGLEGHIDLLPGGNIGATDACVSHTLFKNVEDDMMTDKVLDCIQCQIVIIRINSQHDKKIEVGHVN